MNSPSETGRLERLGFYTFFTGQNMIYLFVTIFLTVYFTSVLGIPAAVVGLILLVARVWDAVNDPLLSIVIEKARFRGGKFKPWVNSVALLVPVFTVLIFSFGDQLAEAALWVRVTYATVIYIAWGMLYTVSDAPAFSLATVMTNDVNERTSIYSIARTFALVGMVVAMVGAPMLVQATHGNWFKVALIISVPAMFFMVAIRGCKERHVLTQPVPRLGEIFGVLFGNRQLLYFIIAFVLINGSNFAFTLMPFIARDVFADPGKTPVFMLAMIAPAALAAPLVPFVVRRFGRVNTFRMTAVATAVLGVLCWLPGYESIQIFIVFTALKAIALAFVMVLPAIMVADCIEYSYVQTGKRMESVAFAAQTFANKASTALGGAVAMGILGAVGFVESTGGELITQPEAVINGMWSVLNLGATVGAIAGLIVFWKGYSLTEDYLEALKTGEQSMDSDVKSEDAVGAVS